MRNDEDEARPADSLRTAPIVAAAERTLATFDLTGVGVAVVSPHGDAALGVGLRDRGDERPYTATTVQNIGSISKVFAVDTVAQLVEAGAADWHDPLTEHLPRFAFPRGGGALPTLLDVAAYRCGTTISPLGYYLFDAARTGDATRREGVRRYGSLSLPRPLRTGWEYGSELFSLLGSVVEHHTGRDWEDVVRDGLMVPLGMSRSGDHRALLAADEPSMYYQRASDGHVVEVPSDYHDARHWNNPGGGVHTCAEDMVAWMKLHLPNRGRPGGVLGKEAARGLLDPVVLRSTDTAPPGTLLRGTATGWVWWQFPNRRVYVKSGGNPGILTLVALVPEADVGVHVQFNQDSSPEASEALVLKVLDLLIDGSESRDWDVTLRDRLRASALNEPTRAGAAGSRWPSEPAGPPHHAGTYSAAGAYSGTVDLEEHGRTSVMRLGRFTWRWNFVTEDHALVDLDCDFLGVDELSGSLATEEQVVARLDRDEVGTVVGFSLTDGADTIGFHRELRAATT